MGLFINARGIIVALAVAFLAYSPHLLDVEMTAYLPNFPDVFEGRLAYNQVDNVEYLLQGQMSGPESIVFYKGKFYSGAQNGYIYEFSEKSSHPVARVGIKDCRNMNDGQSCGRPLGLRVGQDNMIYIADVFYGINRLDPETGDIKQIVPNHVVDGKLMKFTDDLDIDNEGNIYFSDADTKWDIRTFPLSFLEHNSNGRILKYNPKTNVTSVLIKNLGFANGVQLAKDQSSVLVCESTKNRVIRYYLNGEKQGQQEIFVDRLPGLPDNIRPSKRGGFWIALIGPRNASSLMFIDHLAPYPFVRKVLVRLTHGIGIILDHIHSFWPNPTLKKIATEAQTGHIFTILPPNSGFMEVDETGKVLRTLYSTTDQIGFISEILEHEDNLYLASFWNPFVGKIKA